MKLYIRTPNDPPHARHAKEPGIARCGQPLGLAKVVLTDAGRSVLEEWSSSQEP